MVNYFKYCINWWNKGGAINYLLLASVFFIVYILYSKKFTKHFVNTIIGILPCVGLLGTVVGMIECFQTMSYSGADVESIAASISKALLTTEVGLAIAIFASMGLLWKSKEDGLFLIDEPNSTSVELESASVGESLNPRE